MDAEDRFTDSENEDSNVVEISQDSPLKETSKKKKQLVSYCDDTLEEDTSSEKDEVKSVGSQVEEEDTEGPKEAVLDVDMFPEPKGTCDPQLQEKITKMMAKMKETDCDWNSVIQNKKSFRNPSIYEKLIEFCGINEFGTNYQPDIYDPNKWEKGSFYDELNEAQKVETEKRLVKEKEKVKFIVRVPKPCGSSPTSEEQKMKKNTELAEKTDTKVVKKKKRNTKWEPAPNTLPILPTIVRPNFSGIFPRMVFIKKP